MSKTKRHIVAQWATMYRGLGPTPVLPPMPRPPRSGYVWTADGQETLLVRARGVRVEQGEGLLGDEEVSDRTVEE